MRPASARLAPLLRPLGRLGTLVLALLLPLGPAILDADALATYRLHSDDFAYVAGSRTWERTFENLFTPHNTHIVPAWRLLTGGVVAAAGGLPGLPRVLPFAAFGTLALAMLGVGLLAARESGRAAVGLAAAAVTATTSVLLVPATWYSAGQTLWAGLGILAMLWWLQGFRRFGGLWRLALAAVSTWIAGGFWTVGHVSGVVGAVYLLADGRRSCRWAALVPLLSSVAAAGTFLALGAGKIDATVSFHGRTSREALDVGAGAWHTLQAIPEVLVLRNLGLKTETTPAQGAVLTLGLVAAWAWSARRRGGATPLEWAAGALIVSSYWVEWSFRGYLPFSSLRGVVPWYDAIPQLGAALLASAWFSGAHKTLNECVAPPSRAAALGIVLLIAALIVANRPKVDAELLASVPPLTEAEAEVYLTPELKLLRARILDEEFAHWHRRALARLAHAEATARRLGIDRAAIRRSFGRVEAPEIPKEYDAADMLDLPAVGRLDDSDAVRRALAPDFTPEPPPTLPVPVRPAPVASPGDAAPPT